MSTKKNKFSIYIYVVITIIGCVLACSSIVPNDYLKLVGVMGALGVAPKNKRSFHSLKKYRHENK